MVPVFLSLLSVSLPPSAVRSATVSPSRSHAHASSSFPRRILSRLSPSPVHPLPSPSSSTFPRKHAHKRHASRRRVAPCASFGWGDTCANEETKVGASGSGAARQQRHVQLFARQHGRGKKVKVSPRTARMQQRIRVSRARRSVRSSPLPPPLASPIDPTWR